jgi:hypothetical protein
MNFEERRKRMVTVAWILASAFARPVPDECSGCHGYRQRGVDHVNSRLALSNNCSGVDWKFAAMTGAEMVS